MDVPAWLIPILQQFPVVALVGVAVWLVLQWSNGKHLAEFARMKAEVDAARSRADAEIDRTRQDRDAEVRRLAEHYTAEVRRLRARITRLENRLGLTGEESES